MKTLLGLGVGFIISLVLMAIFALILFNWGQSAGLIYLVVCLILSISILFIIISREK